MKIYRVEHLKSQGDFKGHRGPHQFCKSGPLSVDCWEGGDVVWPNDPIARPTPQDDEMPYPQFCFKPICDMRFGFRDLDYIEKWFHETNLRALQAGYGVKVYTYEAEPLSAGNSGQVAFDMKKAKRLPDVYNFETLKRE